MSGIDGTRIVAIVGRKNSGKTTLLVAVAAELRRRGVRVASVKHGHHEFEIDHPGTDSWRHVHEGSVEAVLLLSRGRMALVVDSGDEELDVRSMIRRHLGGGGYDVVLVEGYKYGDLPKVEIYRRAVHAGPVYDPTDTEAAARFLAIVTDDPALESSCPRISLTQDARTGAHVSAVADVVLSSSIPGPAVHG